jgi:hypothetical protein
MSTDVLENMLAPPSEIHEDGCSTQYKNRKNPKEIHQ